MPVAVNAAKACNEAAVQTNVYDRQQHTSITAGGNNEARTCQIAKLNVDFVLIHDFC